MIDPTLFAEPVALDRNLHLNKRLKPGNYFHRSAGMNAMFVTAVEFIDVGREYPIVFVEAGTGPEDQREVAPMAVLGLAQGENLWLNDDGTWRAKYVPALLRGYPLGIARTGDDGNYIVVVDAKAQALSDTEGERIFNDDGTPGAFVEGVRPLLENIEAEAQRTRLLGRALLDLDLLQPMRFDAKLPDGRELTVDGFLAVDEKKFSELPSDKVKELHKNGVLAMVYAHLFSMSLMRRLVEMRVERAGVAIT